MYVISGRDTANESLERILLPEGQTHEQRAAWVLPGLPISIAAWLLFAGGLALIFGGNSAPAVGLVLLVISGLVLGGAFVVQPNESRVLILFGRYVGSVTEAGLW